MKKVVLNFFINVAFIFGASAQCVNSTPMAAFETIGQNFIATRVPSIPGITDASLFSGKTICEMAQQVQYFDGLGRPIQTVSVKGSPGLNDVVQSQIYDNLGREALKLLPITSSVNNGSYKAGDPETLVKGFYNPSSPGAPNIALTNFPVAKTVFEGSPLSRVLEQGLVGDAWQLSGTTGAVDAGHTKRVSFTTNDNTVFDPNTNLGSRRVAMYTAIVNTDGSRSISRLNGNATYANNELFVTITKGENWSTSDGCAGTMEQYKDKEGKVILSRTYNKSGNQYQVFSTYYVYDDLGLLSFVLPPKSEPDNDNAINQNILDNLCYQYRYNNHRLLSFKKIPGKDWEYLIYNWKEQLVATQDGKQRTRNEWKIYKYDN